MSFLRSILTWLPIRILDRYLARQVLTSTFIAVAVLSVILVLGTVFRAMADGLSSGLLTLGQIPGLMWDSFGFSLSFTVPWGILTAVLLVFGRLSADNELTTMRMSGLSLARICVPIFLVATILSLLCFWVNVKIAPESYKSLKAQNYNLVLNEPEKLFEPQKVISEIPGYVMYCDGREGKNPRTTCTCAVPPWPSSLPNEPVERDHHLDRTLVGSESEEDGQRS